MARYNVEFKKADNEGYLQTKRVYPDCDSAVKEALAMLNSGGDFEFLVVRRIKEKLAPAPKITKEVSK